MKVISGSPKFDKRFFPSLWFGFLTIVLIIAILNGGFGAGVAPVVMMIFGYFLFKHTAWDLADEVVDHHGSLVFRRGDLEQEVKLSDIINISYSHLHSPDRITVHSRTDGPIGKELVFKPPSKWNPFSRSPLIEELIHRVDRARNT